VQPVKQHPSFSPHCFSTLSGLKGSFPNPIARCRFIKLYNFGDHAIRCQKQNSPELGAFFVLGCSDPREPTPGPAGRAVLQACSPTISAFICSIHPSSAVPGPLTYHATIAPQDTSLTEPELPVPGESHDSVRSFEAFGDCSILKIPAGKSTAFIGPRGCCKSTVLRGAQPE